MKFGFLKTFDKNRIWKVLEICHFIKPGFEKSLKVTISQNRIYKIIS